MLNGEGNKNCKNKSVVYHKVKHSSYIFYGKKVSYQRFCCLCSCSVFFFTAAGFYLTGFSVTASISHILTDDEIFLVGFPSKFVSFVFLSLALALSVLSTSV